MRSNCNNYYYVTLKTLDSIDEETLELLLTAISKTSRRPNDNNNNTRCAACENEHVTIPRREGTATIGDNRVRKIQPAFPLSLSLSPKSKELRSDELCIEGRRHPMKYGGGGERVRTKFQSRRNGTLATLLSHFQITTFATREPASGCGIRNFLLRPAFLEYFS